MPLLHVGDPFPPLGLTQPGGEALALPGAFAGNFSVVLFYRGSWCRYCVEQLRAFQRASVRLAEAGIEVAALSVDDETTTAELSGSTVSPSPSVTAPMPLPYQRKQEHSPTLIRSICSRPDSCST